jgi:hypothetical protein
VSEPKRKAITLKTERKGKIGADATALSLRRLTRRRTGAHLTFAMTFPPWNPASGCAFSPAAAFIHSDVAR